MVLIAMMVAAAGFTYTTKHGAEAELSKLRRLEAAIRFEEETIDVLNADWSLLTQPSRLQRLSEVYEEQLGLQVLEARQVVGLEELPRKPPTIEDILENNPGSMASRSGAGTDAIVTGAIVR